MVSTTTRERLTATGSTAHAVIMFVEIRGEATADLLTLASDGTCPACLAGTCRPIPAYLRISADKFEDDASLADLKADRGVVREAQSMIALVEDATQHVILFVDNDLSASKKRKPAAQWWAALDYVREFAPAKLLGVKHDRLGRRMADLEDLDDICLSNGTRVITLADGDLFANPAWPFLAAMAKTEARNIGFRVKLAQASRRAKGLDSGGGNRPFGYAADRMTQIPAEVDAYRTMVDLFLAGTSGREIGIRLNAKGVKRAEGGEWTSGRVRDTLRNPRYAGHRTEGTTIVGKGAWAALISDEKFAAITARLAETNNRKSGGRPMTSLLGGLARCGYCETPLYAASVSNKMADGTVRTRPTYKCSKDIGGCGKVHRSRATIDAYVTAHALAMVNADVAANEAVAVRARVDQAQTLRTDLDLRQESNRVEYASGRLDAAAYYAARDAMARDGRALDKEWRSALVELEALSAETRAAEQWAGWTTDKRRRFLTSKLAAVLVFKSTKRGVAAREIQPGEVEILDKPRRSPQMVMAGSL